MSCWWRALFYGSKPPSKIGRRTYVDPSVQFIGQEYVQIGDRSIVSEGCWFNVNRRSGNEPSIVIGDHCYVGRRSFFNAGKKIVIGPYCMISNDSNIIGSDHDFSDPFRPYISATVTADKVIRIGPNCWLGSNCTVLKGVSIGFGSLIGAGSVVTKSVPPLSIAVGNPCKVINRYRMTERRWIPVSDWTHQDDTQTPTEEEYLSSLREKYPWVSMPYVVGGRRRGHL